MSKSKTREHLWFDSDWLIVYWPIKLKFKKSKKQTITSKPKSIQSKGNFVGKFLEIPEIIETTKKEPITWKFRKSREKSQMKR